jgi:hypothetical protein
MDIPQLNVLKSVFNFVKDRIIDKESEEKIKSLPVVKQFSDYASTVKKIVEQKLAPAPALQAKLLPGVKEKIVAKAQEDAKRIKSTEELKPATMFTKPLGRGLTSAGLQLMGKNVYTPNPNSDFEKVFLGDDPIYNSKLTAQKVLAGENTIDVKNQGGNTLLAFGLGINALDVMSTFTGGGKKTALTKIANATKVEEILPELKSILGSKFDTDILNKAAEDLVKITNYNGVRSYLKNLTGIDKVLNMQREANIIDKSFDTKTKLSSQLVNDIASSKDEKEIARKLSGFIDEQPTNIPSEEATRLASQLKNISDPKEVYAILNNLDNQPKTGKMMGSINLDKLDIPIEAKANLKEHYAAVKDDIELAKGSPVSLKEVAEAAKESKVLRKVFTRADSLKLESSIQAAKNRISQLERSLVEIVNPNTRKAIIEEILNLLPALDSAANFSGRLLQSFKNIANSADGNVVNNILQRINKAGANREEVLKRAADVNWKDADAVIKFYRSFVKPTFTEVLSEFRYNNMLSNPRSHLRNISTNILQTLITKPLTRTVEAGIDMVSSALSGKQREVYFKEVTAYYRGAIKNIFNAAGDAFDAMKGKGLATQFMEAEGKIPTGALPKFLRIPTLALEAGDRFFTKMIFEGEKAAMLKRGMNEAEATKEAAKDAQYSVFRQSLDTNNKTGQGKLLSGIDKFTAVVDNLRKIPGGDWIVPFLRTPMNIAKQMVEYSPFGLANLAGNAKKKEALAKAFIGSTIGAWGAKEAFMGNTTWGVPKDAEEKELFFASGKKPYSVKIGGKWVPMIYLGPLAYPLAIASSFKYYTEDSHKKFTDSELTKIAKGLMGSVEFWSQQTFLENIGNMIDLVGNQDGKSLDKNLAFTSTQVIPMSGLLKYISTIIDPVFRKSNSFLEEVEKGLPFFSKNLDAYRNPGVPGMSGTESKRDWYNYLTPWDINSEKEEYNKLLQMRSEELDSNSFLSRNNQKVKDQAQKMLEDFMSDNVSDDRVKEIQKELSSNEQLKNTFKTYVKKAGETEAALLSPIIAFKDPKYTAQIIYTRTQTAETDEEWKNNVEDFIKMLQQNGLMTDEVKDELKKIVTADAEKEKIDEIESKNKSNPQDEFEFDITIE